MVGEDGLGFGLRAGGEIAGGWKEWQRGSGGVVIGGGIHGKEVKVLVAIVVVHVENCLGIVGPGEGADASFGFVGDHSIILLIIIVVIVGSIDIDIVIIVKIANMNIHDPLRRRRQISEIPSIRREKRRDIFGIAKEDGAGNQFIGGGARERQ